MLIAGPNLTIDRTLGLAALHPGQVQRAGDVTVTPGGKGLNVARVATALGEQARLVGFTAGHTGAAVAAMIAEEGVALSPVAYGGEARCAMILLEDDGRSTVLNEPGPALGEGDWARYEATVEAELCQGAPALVCTGSCPPATPDDAYARLVAVAHRHGVAAIVDAARAQLAGVLAAGPDVVTPNLGEAEAVLDGAAGEPIATGPQARDRAVRAAEQLHARGAAIAVVTAAQAGVAVVGRDARWWLPALSVEAVNAVGAGDALVAALVGCWCRDGDLAAALRAGVATAAASVESAVGGFVDAVRARKLGAAVAPPEAV